MSKVDFHWLSFSFKYVCLIINNQKYFHFPKTKITFAKLLFKIKKLLHMVNGHLSLVLTEFKISITTNTENNN